MVTCPTSAQVMISRFMGSSPTSGPVVTAWSLEPASDSVSLPLSAPLPLMLCLSKINKNVKKNFFKKKGSDRIRFASALAALCGLVRWEETRQEVVVAAALGFKRQVDSRGVWGGAEGEELE